MLQNDVVAAGTCFTIKASNIRLDLNGHTVTFGDGNFSEVPNREFELWTGAVPTDWTVRSGSVRRANAIFFGASDLVFAPGGGIIRSAPFRLHGGKTYLGFAFVKAGYNDRFEMRLLDAQTGSVLASYTVTGINRGFASNGSELKFRPSVDTTVAVELECVAAGECTVGMVDVKPAFDYGILSYGYKRDDIAPDVPASAFGNADNVEVYNGTIQQGNGNAIRSAGIYHTGGGWNIHDVTISVNGIHTDGISGNWTKGVSYMRNHIRSTSIGVLNRMHGTAGIKISRPSKTVQASDNIVDGVPQAGISVYTKQSDNLADCTITGNTIRQREVVTEGYGIILGGAFAKFEIRGNTIQPYQGRGILLDGLNYGPLRNGVVRDNQILGIAETRNAEYGENSMEATGIRIRNWGGSAPVHDNIEIFGNTITGMTDASHVHAVYGININASARGDNIFIHDNTIRVTATGKGRNAAAIAFQSTVMDNGGILEVHHNLLSSNDAFLKFGGNDGKEARGIVAYANTFTRPQSIASVGRGIAYGFWNGAANDNILARNSGIDESDPTNYSFEGSAKKSIIAGKNRIEVYVVQGGVPVDGAVVRLKDPNDNITLFEKTTGADGKVVLYTPIAYLSGTAGTPSTRTYPQGSSFPLEIVKSGFSSLGYAIQDTGDQKVTADFSNNSVLSQPLSQSGGNTTGSGTGATGGSGTGGNSGSASGSQGGSSSSSDSSSSGSGGSNSGGNNGTTGNAGRDRIVAMCWQLQAKIESFATRMELLHSALQKRSQTSETRALGRLQSIGEKIAQSNARLRQQVADFVARARAGASTPSLSMVVADLELNLQEALAVKEKREQTAYATLQNKIQLAIQQEENSMNSALQKFHFSAEDIKTQFSQYCSGIMASSQDNRTITREMRSVQRKLSSSLRNAARAFSVAMRTATRDFARQQRDATREFNMSARAAWREYTSAFRSIARSYVAKVRAEIRALRRR